MFLFFDWLSRVQFDGEEAGGTTITVVPSPVLPVSPFMPSLPVLPVLPVLPCGPAGPGVPTVGDGTFTVVGLSHATRLAVTSSAATKVEAFMEILSK